MNLQIRLCMGSELIKSHGDSVNFSSPEGEGFPPSPKETLNLTREKKKAVIDYYQSVVMADGFADDKEQQMLGLFATHL
ncbi:MAG: hypothetical protein ACLFVT_09835 [Syntrophobacteria bacterium]